MSPEISIVIPVYNSGQILKELFLQITRSLQDYCSYEVIFVNDGSSDTSWNTLAAICKEHLHVVAVDLRKNSGQDNAILAGLRVALGSFIVIMDDDLQHDPADIPAMHQECLKGYDVCYASFISKKQSLIKNAGSKINGLVAGVLAEKPGGIYLSAFKIINKETVNEVVKFAGPYPYIDGIILSITSRIGQIMTTHHSRFAGKGNYSIRRSAAVFMKMFTGFSVLPLRIATVAGLLATITGMILAIKYLYDYFVLRDFIEGWTTVVVLIIFFGGLILVTLGIVGEYIGRVYLAVNHKPQYSIAEIIRHDDTQK